MRGIKTDCHFVLKSEYYEQKRNFDTQHSIKLIGVTSVQVFDFDAKTKVFRTYDLRPGADTGGIQGMHPPTRPKDVLTRHLISLKINAKNDFVLHTKN